MTRYVSKMESIHIVSLHNKGMPSGEIGRLLGRRRDTVERHLKSQNIRPKRAEYKKHGQTEDDRQKEITRNDTRNRAHFEQQTKKIGVNTITWDDECAGDPYYTLRQTG